MASAAMSGQNLPVAIAGGGIGGLSAALAIARLGLAAHVFERRATFPDEGAGIQIGPNGSKILIELGLAEALRAAAAEPDGISVRDGVDGRELSRFPLGAWIRDRHGGPYWTLHRQDLHAVLLAAAKATPGITFSTGADVLSFQNRDDCVDVRVAESDPVEASALIAADGLWSRLRGQVTAALALQRSGKCAYRSVALRSNFPGGLAANDVHIWLSPGAHVVHYPVRQGREIAIVVVVDDTARGDSWSVAAPEGWLGAHAAAFPTALRHLLTGARTWRMWPLQTLAPLAHWTDGRVALIGDAAHPILPFLAQGGVMAIEDAAVLAACLSRDGRSVAEQLNAFARLRQSRTARVAAASKRNGRIYHLSGPMALARNAALLVAPPSLLMAGYDWLYGWEH